MSPNYRTSALGARTVKGSEATVTEAATTLIQTAASTPGSWQVSPHGHWGARPDPGWACGHVARLRPMTQAAVLPGWAIACVAFGTPLLAFIGVFVCHMLTRRGSDEQDLRWRREQTMRMLRWAAELAVDKEDGRNNVGVAALSALQDSELLQRDDQDLISAVLSVSVEPVLDVYDEGDEVQEVD